MDIKIKYEFFLFQKLWIGGMVIYPYVLFKRTKEEVTDKIFRHELQHVYQVQRMGWIKFYVSYLWLLMKHGYKKHPYEIEADERELDPLTAEERALKDNS